MSAAGPKIEVLHGVNLDQLGKRDPAQYGSQTLSELEQQIREFGLAAGLQVSCFQTNHEGDYVEALHRLRSTADGLILNPGAWTHYSWAIRDALEITGLPSVEVHLSAVETREEFRHHSVITDLCLTKISGRGADGYRDALRVLAKELAE